MNGVVGTMPGMRRREKFFLQTGGDSGEPLFLFLLSFINRVFEVGIVPESSPFAPHQESQTSETCPPSLC